MDTACALTFIAHGFYGIEAMIGDYVPLIAPLAVAKVSYFNLILYESYSMVLNSKS